MPAVAQGELFPSMIEIRPTIAMRAGESFVTQCSWCGLLVCAETKIELGPCPACSTARPTGYPQSWWRQDLPVGPFTAPADLDLPTCVGEPEPLL